MLRWIKEKFKSAEFNHKIKDNKSDSGPNIKISRSLIENNVVIRKEFSNSSDLICKELIVSEIKVQMYLCEGMVNNQTMAEILLSPLQNLDLGSDSTPSALLNFIYNKSMYSHEVNEITTINDALQFIMSGFVVMFIEGENKGVAFGMQGFNFRGIGDPDNETNERGSREGFTEPIRINISMVRRRIKSTKLVFEFSKIGKTSQTDICFVYMSDKVSKKLLFELKRRLAKADIDIVLDSAYLRPYLELKPVSIFSSIGYTERPDTLAAKISEGRVGILVDGTPFAIVVPYLFSEHFQSFDDYSHQPYFASMVRIIKYIAFFFSVFLAGIYVATASYHPEIIPQSLLFNIASAQENTPMPLVLEALFVNLVYEIMREAGLRLPKPIGHAIGILGALVIGDAAVTAGIIGSPMVMVIALTAISSFVVHQLYEPISFLRFAFIILGGTSGLFGITVGVALLGFNICALNSMGIPYLSPISPIKPKLLRDVFIRADIKKLSEDSFKMKDLTESDSQTEDS